MKQKTIIIIDDDLDDMELFCKAVDIISHACKCEIQHSCEESLKHLRKLLPGQIIFS